MSGIMNMFVAAKTTIATAVDEFFNRVTLLLNTGSTNGAQNNTFIDSSSNGYSITRNPATGPNAPTQGTFTPFSQTGWSNYFNGSTDYLTVAGGSSLAFGSGDFSLLSVFLLSLLADSNRVWISKFERDSFNFLLLVNDSYNLSSLPNSLFTKNFLIIFNAGD